MSLIGRLRAWSGLLLLTLISVAFLVKRFGLVNLLLKTYFLLYVLLSSVLGLLGGSVGLFEDLLPL